MVREIYLLYNVWSFYLLPLVSCLFDVRVNYPAIEIEIWMPVNKKITALPMTRFDLRIPTGVRSNCSAICATTTAQTSHIEG